jgi:hypothetical protein
MTAATPVSRRDTAAALARRPPRSPASAGCSTLPQTAAGARGTTLSAASPAPRNPPAACAARPGITP